MLNKINKIKKSTSGKHHKFRRLPKNSEWLKMDCSKSCDIATRGKFKKNDCAFHKLIFIQDLDDNVIDDKTKLETIAVKNTLTNNLKCIAGLCLFQN